jgi:hemerythrin-like domain-containing protein
MGMWIIHKFIDSIEECKAGDSLSQYESIDKAAAFWIGSVSADDNGVYELAEQLGEHISHKEGARLN